MQVPVLSIVFMAVSALISIGLPVALFVIFRKKYGAKFLPMLIGAAAFIVFALVLERSIHLFVFGRFTLQEKPLLYILYGIFMAGIFEESARFISFNFLKKTYEGIGTGLSYGVGHGGIEAVLLAGLAMINNIITSIFFNTGAIEKITGNLQGDQLEPVIIGINTLITVPPPMFLVGGIERLFAVCVQISLSVIVFYSVYAKGKTICIYKVKRIKAIWLFPFAILLHAITDIPAASYQIGMIKSLYLVEGLTGLWAAALVFLAVKVHRSFKEPQGSSESPAPDSTNSCADA